MTDHLEQLRTSVVVDQEGSRIGGVGRIYLDDATGQVTFVTAKTGLFGQREVFVPVVGALLTNGVIAVPFGSDLVTSAPCPTDEPRLTPDQEAVILGHFGLPFTVPAAGGLN